MTEKGFGLMVYKGDIREIRKEIFFKPSPETFTESNQFLKCSGFSHAEYVARFNDMSEVNDGDKRLIAKFHPHREVLNVSAATTSAATSGDNLAGGTLESEISVEENTLEIGTDNVRQRSKIPVLSSGSETESANETDQYVTVDATGEDVDSEIMFKSSTEKRKASPNFPAKNTRSSKKTRIN